MQKILVTGATGQIGSELTLALRERYGAENVFAAGHRRPADESLTGSGPCCSVDVRDAATLTALVADHQVDTIFHLASLLSAVAEDGPQLAWDVNANGLVHVLEAARMHGCAVFFPSSIGAFGPSTPRDNTPQITIQRPNTMYGITKLTGELLCDYYHQRFALDTRGLRYPGLISHRTLPGGGTTDYAVHIFHAALKEGHYDCFLDAGTRLDMMYMPDALRAAMQLMEADSGPLRHRNSFNVTAMSIAPEDIAAEIEKHIPGFTISYAVDPVRQAIADSWPKHMDDSAARREWGWQPGYDLAAMVEDMLTKLRTRMTERHA